MKQQLKIILLVLCFAHESHAQHTLKGMVFLNAGMEFGGGLVTLDDPFPGTKTSGGTLFRAFPLALEVGISDHIGMGFEYRKMEYRNHLDSIRANSNDFLLLFNYHLITTKQTNSFTGLKAGLSDFQFEKIRNAAVFQKKGVALQLYGGVNMLFVKNLGMQISLGLNSLLYPKGTLDDPASVLPIPYGVKIYGLDMGMGIFMIL